MGQTWLSNIKMEKNQRRNWKKHLIELKNLDFFIKNHIPNIYQTPQNQQNLGGFYGKTREVPLSKEIEQINDFGG